MAASVLQVIASELAWFFEPVSGRLRTQAVADLFGELGWHWPAEVEIDASDVILSLDTLLGSLRNLDANSELPDYLDALKKALEAATKIGQLAGSVPDPADFSGDAAQALQMIRTNAELVGKRALALLVLRYLENRLPAVCGFFQLIGVVRDSRVPPTDVAPGYYDIEIDWSRVRRVMTDPGGLLGDLYDWGRETPLRMEELLSALETIALGLGIPAAVKALPSSLEHSLTTALGAATNGPSLGPQLEVPLLEKYSDQFGSAHFGLHVLGTPHPMDPGSGIKGISLVPFARGQDAINVQITRELKLETNGHFGGGFAILLFPGGKAQFLEGLAAGEGHDMTLAVRLAHERADAPLVILGSRKGSRFEYTSCSGTFGLSGSPDDPDVFVEFSLKGASFILERSEGDGFLNKVLPEEQVIVGIETVLGFSSKRGFYSGGGSADLEFTIPVHQTTGPITIDSVYIALALGLSKELPSNIRIGITAAAVLGPLTVSIQRVGVEAALSFPPNGQGNLGSANLAIGFLPPTGAGLAIAAGPVTGGGFVSHDEATGRYAGILDLHIGDIGLVAIGIITTKLPGGAPGYALFINIGVTFSPAIPLPYNFCLSGCGGLAAVNRSMDVEALRSGLRNKTLDSILFPEDPILNASKIISDSERVFPIHVGRYVVGPMAKLCWSKNILVADIAVVIEFPAPIVIALLGQITAAFPQPDYAIVLLHLDVLGVLDIAKQEFSLDATLYDSRIETYDLYGGDSALRMSWGATKTFGLSLGGWHPKFDPPPKFPQLRRLTLALASSSSFELSCSVYHALSSNTLQLGAGLRLHAECSGAELDGKLSFDGLVIFSPLEFEVEMDGSISASYKGHDIASIHLNLDLSGPTPWHAKGSAKFSILCWDVKAKFNKTWGSDEKAQVAAIDPSIAFLAEVKVIENWGSVLLPNRSAVESLKALEIPNSTDAPAVFAHPAAGLEFRQRLLPLGLALEKFGAADVKDHCLFDICLTLGPATLPPNAPPFESVDVTEYFARGQFKALSKEDSLSKPSYEPFNAGANVSPTRSRVDGAIVHCDLEYESILICGDGVSASQPHAIPKWAVMRRTLAPLRFKALHNQGLGKFKTGGDSRVAVLNEAFTVVNKATLTRADEVHRSSSKARLTQTEAEDLAAAAVATGSVLRGTVMVVPEVEEVAGPVPPEPPSPAEPGSGEEPLARYLFIPTVRDGLAAYITAEEAETRAEISASLTPYIDNAPQVKEVVPVCVGIYGPGDVLGLDSRVVSRTDPQKNVWDFESNMLVMCELSEPDLLWRFTPRAAEASGKLTPWLTLIVLKQEGEFKSLEERAAPEDHKGALPIRWIQDVSISQLPNLDYAWMWAHTQVTAGETDDHTLSDNEVRDLLSAEADTHVVSRLICPRRLAPGTKYTAFIVPTFKIAQVAAGLIVALGPKEDALTPGWTKADAEENATVSIPYYYKWDFGTSASKGDFEYLVRLLEPKPLPNLGKRNMDCSAMPYVLPPCPGSSADAHSLELEGALMSPDLCPGQWKNTTPEIITFRSELAKVLNMPANVVDADTGATTSAPPPVVPPIYGRWHTRRRTVDPTATTSWQDDVNLDPRQRAAAGFGVLVVQKEQEALKAAMWEQLGAIDAANEIVRRGQLGLGASKRLYGKLGHLSEAHLLWMSAPVFERVQAPSSLSPTPTTIANCLEGSPIPRAAFDPAFRRVLRPRGGVRKRQRKVPAPAKGQDLLSRLNNSEAAAAGPPPTPPGMPSMCSVTDAAVARLINGSAPARQAQGKWRVVGRVRYQTSGRGVVGVKVEAWDKDPFFSDLVGAAVTDEHGAFIIEFDATYFREWSLGKRPDLFFPDLFFKVFYRGELLKTTKPVMRNVPPGDTPVVIELEDHIDASTAPARQAQSKWRVVGRVRYQTSGRALVGVKIEAWDKDPFFSDLVGAAVTDEHGTFIVEFDASYFQEWFLDKRPDLFFKVFYKGKLLKTTTPVMRNVPPGDTLVEIELDDHINAPTASDGPSRVMDFCEAAITPEAILEATDENSGAHQLQREAALSISNAMTEWLSPLQPPTQKSAPIELTAVHEAVKTAIDPAITIPTRISMRLKLLSGVHQQGELGLLESEVEFPQPMYESLAAISQDLVLPGIETVPANVISLVRSNARFQESFLLGLNTGWGSEAIWSGAQVYPSTTFFRQFWNVEGCADPDADPEQSKDIERITTWKRSSALGSHNPRKGDTAARAVLLIRSDLLKRFPETLVYAVESDLSGNPVFENRVWPIFSGALPPDLTFLGFDKTVSDLADGGHNNKGYFIVLEERLSQPRFGFDDPPEGESVAPPLPASGHWWYDLTWAHVSGTAQGTYIDGNTIANPESRTPRWGESSATMANICLQRPVRVSIHARKMLSNLAAFSCEV